MNRKQLSHTLILVLAALIWGLAFVSQSVGADYVPPLTFCALRGWLALLVLVPLIRIADRVRLKNGKPSGAPANRTQKKAYAFGGICCGTALFAATVTQQIGIASTTTAKAGFITAMYVVLVPVFSVFFGRVPEKKIWFCVALGVAGLYFLCLAGQGGAGRLGTGDLFLLVCAVLFTVQILCVNHFVQHIDGIRLSAMQMLTEGILATVFALFLEHPSWTGIRTALPAVLYAGIFSSGIAYTLQIIGQEGVDPTVASLAMCLESVFSALGGWLILHETLSGTEFFGCALMLAAIVISQIPMPRKHSSKGSVR